MNQLYVKVLFFFMFTVCVNSSPMFKDKKVESKPSYFTATPAMVRLHAGIEMDKGLEVAQHEKHHREEKRKIFALHPMQIHHNNEITKAERSHEIHTDNIDQLLISEKSGAFKITKSKSGNHDHYNAILPGME